MGTTSADHRKMRCTAVVVAVWRAALWPLAFLFCFVFIVSFTFMSWNVSEREVATGRGGLVIATNDE